MGDEIPVSALCDRYEQLYTGLVADTMDDLGYTDQTMSREIDPLVPEMRTAGIAYPVSGRPNQAVDDEAQINRFIRMLEGAPEHSILAMETRDTTSAHIGELSTATLANNGCRGAVLDGGARDTGFIQEQGFPVFAAYRTPADSVTRWEILDWNETATVGGVGVAPGDVVLGDIDGVIVVPQEIRDTVLEEAESRKETEKKTRDAVRDGIDPLEAVDKAPTLT